jgi:23S rRNA (uridine2479-2'-O)-methyltransferase
VVRQGPRIVRLYSENNDFQRAEVLRRNRQKRRHYGEFFVEGVLPIERLLEHHWAVKAFYYSRERPLSDWAENILHASRADTHFELSLPLMQKLSAKEDTSELIAVVHVREDDVKRISFDRHRLAVVFDRPAGPGNLGSIIRSCDALQADGMITTGHAADIYDPESISASRGSLFALPVVRVEGPTEIRSWIEDLRRRYPDLQVVATDETGAAPIWESDLNRPTVLLLGNETWGLSAAMRELADTSVRIPMWGAATSLNVAAAASILLYEIARQRAISLQ